ncbi:MAG: hypothetical protein WDW38_001740 [Sanguina aurantia]
MPPEWSWPPSGCTSPQLAHTAQCCTPSSGNLNRCSSQDQPPLLQQQQQQLLPSESSLSCALRRSLPSPVGFVDVCGVALPCDARWTGPAISAAITPTSSSRGKRGRAAAAASSHVEVDADGRGGGGAVTYVATPSVQRSLRAVALALAQQRPLLLEGPPGCGKSALLDELARMTHRDDVIHIHLDDQMDSKGLLGAYVCSAVPGEFVWQPGPLTQAVVEGRWVVIEDINLAPPDVLAALVPLLDSRSLHISSRGEVLQAADGFQLLATITTAPGGGGGAGGAYRVSSVVQDMLGGLWSGVRMEALSLEEQMSVLSQLFPMLQPLLATATAALCMIYLAVGQPHHAQQPAPAPGPEAAAAAAAGAPAGGADVTAAGDGGVLRCAAVALDLGGLKAGDLAVHLGRHFSVRDLIKWCRRMQSIHVSLLETLPPAGQHQQQPASPAADAASLPVPLRQAAFSECADCFAALVARPEPRRRLLAALAALWALPTQHSVEQYESLGKPIIREGPTEVCIGRVRLQRLAAREHAGSGGGTFARTGHALRLMERVAAGLAGNERNEPVLLVGETGTGKTTLLSRVAEMVGAKLVAFNLSQQTDSSDLLGGFKPVDVRDALLPLLAPFLALVQRTFSNGDNDVFLSRVSKLAERKKWSQLLASFKGAMARVLTVDAAAATAAADSAMEEVTAAVAAATVGGRRAPTNGKAARAPLRGEGEVGGAKPKEEKKRKRGGTAYSDATKHAWRSFAVELAAAERTAAVAEGGFAFAFAEGQLVRALREGWWLLLDEINLAPPEVLERVAGLLEGAGGSVLLVERGDTVAVTRHPNFRLVAAMNPATDAGKHELPAPLRNRFTELFVPEPSAREDLCALAAAYLAGAGPAPPVDAAVDFYCAAREEAETRLTDGAGAKPTYNLRTLSRALDYARAMTPSYGLQRALLDGCSMAFSTQLSRGGQAVMDGLLKGKLLPGIKSFKALMRTPPAPPGETHVLFEHFWLERGPLPLPEGGRDADGGGRKFVATPSVSQHLCNLARAVLIRKHPILLQGPTSSGKTSLVAYLAAQTGHPFVRINNHEHTELSEYLGSYVGDATGKLVFRPGPLVTALQQGHWLVLDELNLAPTEVLEALNRLLDDNRELYVPELGALSRAFRSRFLELHVDDIPDGELAEILERRCDVAPSYASKLVAVMRELQRQRQGSNVFAGKHGFITPRDLFRWAERGAVGYTALAVDGFMVLGEKLRSPAERALVAGVLEKSLNVKMDMEAVYQQSADAPAAALAAITLSGGAPAPATASAPSAADDTQDVDMTCGPSSAAAAAAAAALGAYSVPSVLSGMVWTRSMQRMFTLVDRCLRHSEPVLLVGETGTGKTTVCQLLALLRSQHLHILNCNQHTEAADFLGGFRPTRGSRECAVAAFGAAAARALGGPLYAEVGVAVPLLPDDITLPQVGSLCSLVTSAVRELSSCVHKQLQLAAEQGSSPCEATVRATALLAEAESALAETTASAAAARTPFVWADGPLVTAMRQGDMILIDEINLAEDAVLERLNSVLETGRSLTLAEKGGSGDSLSSTGGSSSSNSAGAELIVAAAGFRVLATMNPGGDFGKKELSPALSNRFTVVWVPSLDDPAELHAILQARLADDALRSSVGGLLLDFWRFYSLPSSGTGSASLAVKGHYSLTVRDLLGWVGFINATAHTLGALPAYLHGAHLTLMDGIGLGVGLPAIAAAALHDSCQSFLASQLPAELRPHAQLAKGDMQMVADMAAAGTLPESAPDGQWGISPFFVHCGPQRPQRLEDGTSTGAAFELRAPTTARNAFRVLRALQLRKAVLLEGSPGVGKTALVAALARRGGHTLVRINLSEQTDMMDLLGADLPTPGGSPGHFTWADGPLLSALKAGHWVLLDELNLAGQSVLEGLNALLDHRSEVFIPELGATFRCHPGFRLFGAQNPVAEGGGRKGLPRSFLNRFSRVLVEVLTAQDLGFIAGALHPRLPLPLLTRMVALLTSLHTAANVTRTFATAGGPWEFNLRDLLRWAQLAEAAVPHPSAPAAPTEPAVTSDEVAAAGPNPSSSTPALDHVAASHPAAAHPAASHPAVSEAEALETAVAHFATMIFEHRLRSDADRVKFRELWREGGWASQPGSGSSESAAVPAAAGPAGGPGVTPLPAVVLSPTVLCVGRARLTRGPGAQSPAGGGSGSEAPPPHLLSWQLPLLESLAATLGANVMALSSRRLRPATAPALQQGDADQQRERSKQHHHAKRGGTCVIKFLEFFHDQQRRNFRPPHLDPHWISLSSPPPAPCTPIPATAPFASPLSSLSSTLAALSALLSDESSHAVGGRFEWVDGSLARAIEHGGWVLLDNANLCNPTVLDRLNPLLEPGGVLFLNECGHTADGPRLIRPHPDFRLILAMDPKHGDVSRAMRNRGIEICVLQPPSTSHASPSPPTTTTTTTTTPTHPSQALPDSGIISDDFASSSDSCWLLSSEGVAGSVLPAAMAHAHAGAVELCRAAHKRPPGSRELCCWAALARTLLQRGWSLPEALQTGWEQAYVQSATLTPAQLAAMYALCADACAAAAAGPEPTVPSADGPGSTVLITGGTGDMDVDITPAAAALAGSAHVGGSSVQEWVEEQSSDGSAGGHRLVAPQLMAVALVAPCKWPASAVSGRELADGSLLGGVMRDSSLVEALLGMCLTAQIQIHPLASTPSHPSTRSSWLELTAESGSATPRSRLSPLQQASLRFLPAPQLAHLLHNRALSTSSTASQQQQQQQREMDLTPSQQQQRQQECEAAVTRLQVAAWTALQVGCASRASSGDVSLRLMWANSTAAGLQAAEATLLPGHSGLGPMGQLASLSSAYLHEVMSHPLTGQLRSTTRSTLAQAGMSEELLQLQPLDLRYTHLLQPYKSCIDAETWAALMQLQQRWGALLAHTGASILQRHAATESEARMGGGVEGGGASVFQLSCWRHARPDDRAAIELELPAVDHLYPVFAAVADLEAALLQPSCSWIWSSDVTFQLESVQRWRQALWHCCHGPLHTPHPSATLHTLHVDRLIWVWTHLSKELRRLATAVSAAIASTPTPPTATTHPHSQPSSHTTSTPAGVHDITGSSSSSSSEEAVAVMEGLGRMRYCLDQMNESLGLSSRPSRPLVWRLCGRPLLPPTGALLLAQQRVQGLCRALGGGSSSGGCYTLDGRGRPAGLADAGIDVDSMLVQLLEGGGAAAAVGMMDGGSAVLASRGPLRARAMAAVAASLCADMALRRAATEGYSLMALVSTMPHNASSTNSTTAVVVAPRPAVAATPRSEPATTRKGGRKSKAEVPAAVVDAAAVTAAAAATAATVSQALAVAAVLQEQVIARIQAVLQGVLAASSSTAVDEDGMEDENRGGEEDVAGEVFCPAAGAVVEASGQLQLPSEWMKSAVTRQLATALTPLQDASGVLSQMDVLSLLSTTTFAHSLPSHPDHTSATTTTTTTITDHNPSDARHHSITIPSAIALLGAVTQRLDTAATNGTGEPLSLAPYQQLAWVLEEAVNNGRGRTDLALSSPAEEGKAAEDWRQLVGGPVTSLAHEIWFRWLQRAAGSTFVTGADGALSSCGGPFRLYLASITYALPTLVRPSLSDVSSKTVRLLQLKLTARSLQQMASASASSASHTTAHPTPTLHHQTTLQLTALFCQLVAAHASTLGDDDSGSSSAAALLRLLQLLLWAAQAACSSSGASAATAAAVAAAVAAVPGQLVGVLSGSSHAVLLSLLQPVLLPCVVTLTECVSAGLVLSRTTSSPLHPTPALESLHGRAWTLLGLLRLHLVAPPPGIDPAGKYSLKRDHLDSEIHGSIAPELQLAALARARSALRAQRDRASAKCVPRPSPPQYQTLQRDVASFCSSLGSASRIVNLLPAPYDSSSNMPAEAWPALSSAQSWLSSAAAWQDRLGVQYPSYVDLLQPVQLALLEMSHGLGILVGSAEAEAAMPLGQRAQLQAAVAMLMAFPQPLPPSLPQLTQPGSDDAQAVAVGAGGVAQDVESGEEDPLLLGAEGLQSLLAARAAAAAAASCAHIGPEQAAKAAQLASFSTRLQAGRTALHLLTRHLVAAGPAQLQLAAATSTATPTPTPTAALTLSPSHGSADGLAGSGVHTAVMRCESLLSSFITSWARIKAFEELEAEADGSVYKASKTVNNSIQTEEVGPTA